MRALVWILVWVVLLAGAGAYLWPKVRALFRRAGALEAELGLAQRRLDEVTAAIDGLAAAAEPAPRLAVFGDPVALRAERERARRAVRKERAARREANRPAWARR